MAARARSAEETPARAPVDVEAPFLPGGLGPALAFDPSWCLVVGEDPVHGAEPALRRARTPDWSRVEQSLLCVADGVIGTRGVLEEEAGEDLSAVAGAGYYEPAPGVGDRLAGLPVWCDLPLVRDLGSGRRVLDLRDGVLTRTVAHDGDGAGEVGFSSARFACAERPGTEVLVAELSTAVLAEALSADALSADALSAGAAPTLRRTAGGGGAAMARSTEVRAGGPSRIVVERVATYVASAREVPAPSRAAEALGSAVGVGPAGLLAEQRARWSERWAAGDLKVAGDAEMTRALRFALFHLRSSASWRHESAVGARGLSGPAYAGHVLWDADVFVLPVLAAVDRRAARSMLQYRLDRLEAAQRRAAGEGRRGARYPWESATTGDDVTPRSGIDQHGKTVAIRTGDLEAHVTADVAWAAWHYASWSGDWAFLEGPGRPLLVETARYWAARICYDDARRAHISRVIGPDEYHEDVDDNAFTNLMARWNLLRAAELVERPRAAPRKAGGRVDGSAPEGREREEAAHWREVAAALVDGYDPTTGRYEQFTGFSRLEPVLVSTLGTPPLAADLVLGHDKVAATQVIKQADVLMAYYLIPEGTAAESLAANLQYYLPRTAHGSSLSPAVHASLLARAGRCDEALDLLSVARAVDLDDLTATTAGGLHLANLGGLWRAVVHGFVGAQVQRPDDDALVLDPRLPDAWHELRAALTWHGTRVQLTCRRESVRVVPDAPLTVQVHGARARVEPPGRWIG